MNQDTWQTHGLDNIASPPPYPKSPVIISSTAVDKSLGKLPVKYAKDCDCTVSSKLSFELLTNRGYGRLVCGAVYQDRFSDEHVILYNPEGEHGVVVLNNEAYRIWKIFEEPRRLIEVERAGHQIDREAIRQMLQTGLLKPEDATIQHSSGHPEVLYVWLHVTNQCNLRCDYCYINKTPEKLSEDTGFAAIDAAFRSAVRGGFSEVHIKYAGGEASLSPHVVLELDRYARSKSDSLQMVYRATILSNGVKLSRQFLESCKSQDINWMISLDGLGEGHDRQRRFIDGRSSAPFVVQTIESMLSLGIKPFLGITVTQRSVNTLAETIKFAIERDLHFNLSFVRDNGQLVNFPSMQLVDDRLIEALDEAFEVIKSNLPRHSLLSMLVDRSDFSLPHERTCGAGQSYLVVDQTGGIAKCPMEISNTVTNVLEEDPLSIIKTSIQGVQNLPVEEKEGCRTCEWRYGCTGGCPKLTHQATGRYDVKSPYCNIYKAAYPKLLRLEAYRLLQQYSKIQLN